MKRLFDTGKKKVREIHSHIESFPQRIKQRSRAEDFDEGTGDTEISFFQAFITPSGIKTFLWGGAVILLLLIILAGGIFVNQTPKPSPTESPVISKEDKSVISQRIDPFEQLSLQATSVYVWDINNHEVLYAKNAREELPLASITKVMSAITAVDLIPPHAIVAISEQALKADGDSGFLKEEQWSFDKLLDLGLVASSNDALAAIASVAGSMIEGPHTFVQNVNAFVNSMNQKAAEIGLKKTHFSNPHGLDTNDYVSGSYGTAQDIAHLFEYTLTHYPEVLESTRREAFTVESLSHRQQEVENTNQVISEIPGLLASKTGYTDLAGGNLAIAFDAGLNQPVVAVVLGSTYEGRFNDMVQLVKATLQNMNSATTIEVAGNNQPRRHDQ